MEKLTNSFDEVPWDAPQPGVREKKTLVGSKVIRLLELTDQLSHPDWCLKGHIGYVVEGSFTLNIDGTEKKMNEADVFVVENDNPAHRHIPIVDKGGRVMLLLIEEPESDRSLSGEPDNHYSQ